MARVYLSAPDVGELESKYVLEAMGSGWVAAAGPDLTAFEAELAARVAAIAARVDRARHRSPSTSGSLR
jgi:dTDP-4-amino-4,6-dideoxygalactose transaminase